jgi:hypothetical protein
MKITEGQLRRLVREQVAQAGGPVQLTHRQKSYIRRNGITEADQYGDPDEGQDYIGIIPDSREGNSDEWFTPFPDLFFTTLVTPEVVEQTYQETSVYKAGTVTIPTGWFWKGVSEYDGKGDVVGPFQTREEAREACLESHYEIITPEAVQTAPNTGSDIEIGF